MASVVRVQESDLDQIGSVLTNPALGPWDYATAAIIFVTSIAIGRGLRIAIRRLVDRSRTDDFVGDLIGRLVNYVVVTFGIVYAMETLGIALGPVLGALGIVGIALAFALQDILENFVAGIIIQVQRPFTRGDEVVTGDHEGTITTVETRTITIETPEGETVRVPSAQVIKNPIVNHTALGRRRTTVEVGVAYDSDLERAVEVARAATAGADGVRTEPAPEVLVQAFGDSSIELAVHYWHAPSIAAHWRTRHAVALAINSAFAEAGVTIPFPQRVVHLPGGAFGPEEATTENS